MLKFKSPVTHLTHNVLRRRNFWNVYWWFEMVKQWLKLFSVCPVGALLTPYSRTVQKCLTCLDVPSWKTAKYVSVMRILRIIFIIVAFCFSPCYSYFALFYRLRFIWEIYDNMFVCHSNLLTKQDWDLTWLSKVIGGSMLQTVSTVGHFSWRTE